MKKEPTAKPLIGASSIARMAGNIASGYVAVYTKEVDQAYVAKLAVQLAYLISAEIDQREHCQWIVAAPEPNEKGQP